jgi:hypothetical protein
MRNWWMQWLLILVVLGAVSQFVQPARTNPPVDPGKQISAHLPMDPAVKEAFARSCNDCHSNTTVWPWYSKVAPASWLLVHDVNEGRAELNFSDWGTGKKKEEGEVLGKICEEVTDGEMPGRMYQLMHPQARLTNADVQAICKWTKNVAQDKVQTTKNEKHD